MILQALNDLYTRLLDEGAVEAPGFQMKEIPWVITVTTDGGFAGLARTGEAGPKGRGKRFSVPAEIKKAAGIASNLLWENPEYALGVAKGGTDEKQAAKVPDRHAAFVKRIRDLPAPARADPGVAAVLTFLNGGDRAPLLAHDQWETLRDSGANVSFRLAGDHCLVCERPSLRSALSGQDDADGTGADPSPWCLVSGGRVAPARLHPSIKGVHGGQTSGTSLVAFNQPAFESHGWEQGDNAPVGKDAAAAYAAALNYLLEYRHDNGRITMHREGETTFVFWAAADSEIPKYFSLTLGEKAEAKTGDDGEAVKYTLKAVRQGMLNHRDDQTAFFILALAPNAARLAVRSWTATTAARLSRRFESHFQAMELAGTAEDAPFPTLWRLLGAMMPGGDIKLMSDGLRSRLSSDIVAAILNGTPYPATILARAVERCRLENSVRPLRAGLIKAVLSRHPSPQERLPTMSLDPDCDNPGYLLGRQFAVLESIQYAAQGKVNTTIRDRYFGAAMASPRAVQPQLERLKNAHLKKLRRDKAGLGVFFERELGSITDRLTADLGYPATLSLDNQGRFILGYHHQRHSYLTRRDDVGEVLTSSESESED